jgi:hypothetical protein
MSNVAQVVTLILGFLAAWITLRPPTRIIGRRAWTASFAFLTAVAVIATYRDAREDAKQKAETGQLIRSTKTQAELLYAQNADLHTQIDALVQSVSEARSSKEQNRSGTCDLKSDVSNELEIINRFLKERLAKSPAYDLSHDYSNDPQYSEKEEAYEIETARLYVQQFWPSIQALLQRAVAASIAPEGTASFATPSWYPEPKWWQAMLKPAYKELVLISRQLPSC